MKKVIYLLFIIWFLMVGCGPDDENNGYNINDFANTEKNEKYDKGTIDVILQISSIVVEKSNITNIKITLTSQKYSETKNVTILKNSTIYSFIDLIPDIYHINVNLYEKDVLQASGNNNFEVTANNITKAPIFIQILNTPPIADAGPDQNIAINSVVFLDGSESFDNDNDILEYTWKFIAVPSDSTASLTKVNTPTPVFITDISGIYIISLTVFDGIEHHSNFITIIAE